MSEIWKDVPGWEGYYRVSTFGRVRSLPRVVYRNYSEGIIRSVPVKGRILKWVWSGGYATVRLCDKANGRNEVHLVHRLVLTTFVGPCPEDMEGCHFPDKNTSNNCLLNLVWATHEENGKHSVIHGSYVGRTCSGGTRAKMSAARIGMRPSGTTRRKMSESRRAYWQKQKLMNQN